MYVYHFIHIWVYVYVKFWRSTTARLALHRDGTNLHAQSSEPKGLFPHKVLSNFDVDQFDKWKQYFGVVLMGISRIVSEGEFSYLIAIIFPFINLSLLLSFVYFSTLFLFFTWLICSKFSFLWVENIFSGLLRLLILLIMVFSMQKCLCLC